MTSHIIVAGTADVLKIAPGEAKEAYYFYRHTDFSVTFPLNKFP